MSNYSLKIKVWVFAPLQSMVELILISTEILADKWLLFNMCESFPNYMKWPISLKFNQKYS